MQSREPGVDEVREALDRVLSRPEFQIVEPNRLVAWLYELRQSVIDAFWSMLARFNLLEIGGSAISLVLRFWLILIAVLLVVHVVTSLVRARRGGLRPSPADAAPAEGSAGEDMDWISAANLAALEGRFRDAVLALYQALLGRLDGQGVLRYDTAKTPGDYRREVRSSPAIAAPFDRFLRGFEPVAFGSRQTDRATFERMSGLARDVVGD